ncbi:MAG: glycosyltransferase family 2 protein, partial [Kiritimatiellae bacterium]|nr:glycosyltransferase family 2 protein [Kiritimatiellia bacterium]
DTPLIHEDFKGMDAYIERHKKYATWEAMVRYRFLKTGQWGEDAVQARLFGSLQERRRFLKSVVTRLPFEHVLWFVYHYVVRLGFLEGRSGLIACRIRSAYIAQVRDEIRLMRDAGNEIHKK